ncbi:MAG: hypothetical protein IPK12_24505 [Gemmatimonadetes bacterium]|nr:hypothetical protein [Gemmatimonadota bacterium]
MTPPPALAAALADRYVLEKEIGRGGMALVYLATRGSTGEQVALKVLQRRACQDRRRRPLQARDPRR